MGLFEISKTTLDRLNDMVSQVEDVQTTPLRDYCKCTGFGG
jgi:hypothetical protein